MLGMRDVIQALERAALREKVKVLVGGAPVTQAFADEIGADGYGESAAVAVEKARQLLGIA
jgi:5-methyltetrahydrofolate--homocysteine methyltransferase